MVKEDSQETNGQAAPASNGPSNNKNRRNRGARSRSPLNRAKGGVGDGPNKAARRVYVANIAFDVKWSDIKDLFKEKIGNTNVTYAQLFEDEQGRSRGCGLVEFSDPASAKKAIETLNRFSFHGRELVVKEDLDCERDRYGRLLLPNRKGDQPAAATSSAAGRPIEPYRVEPYRAEPQSWNTYGLSVQFLDSLGIECPLNSRIFVANLDYKVGEKKLEEIFRLAGKVIRVKLYTDSTGNSKGHGTVEYDHPVEAVQAISMFNDQKLYGRPMSIRMDKYEPEEAPEVLPTKLPAGLEGIGKGLGVGGQPLNVSKSLLGQSTPGPSAASGSVPPPMHNAPPQAPPASDPLANLNYANIDTRALSSLVSSGALDNVLASVQNQQRAQQAPPNQPAMPSMYNSSYERDFRESRLSEPIISQGPIDKYPPPMRAEVIVRNLPPNFNWQLLRNRFQEMGDISYAELKGPGTAVIRYHLESSAQRAVQLLHGLRFENRALEVNHYSSY